MIEFGVLTGEVEKNIIRVQFRTGEKFWAPMVVIGNNVSLPSEIWIKNNYKNFLALVSFEKDIFENPMVIGFYPVVGASSESFNDFEKLLKLVGTLIETLQQATTMTKLGPQKFMADAQSKLIQAKSDLTEITNDILKLSL